LRRGCRSHQPHYILIRRVGRPGRRRSARPTLRPGLPVEGDRVVATHSSDTGGERIWKFRHGATSSRMRRRSPLLVEPTVAPEKRPRHEDDRTADRCRHGNGCPARGDGAPQAGSMTANGSASIERVAGADADPQHHPGEPEQRESQEDGQGSESWRVGSGTGAHGCLHFLWVFIESATLGPRAGVIPRGSPHLAGRRWRPSPLYPRRGRRHREPEVPPLGGPCGISRSA
jgi:hypothetical protein